LNFRDESTNLRRSMPRATDRTITTFIPLSRVVELR
jgi:hypothetical protein